MIKKIEHQLKQDQLVLSHGLSFIIMSIQARLNLEGSYFHSVCQHGQQLTDKDNETVHNKLIQ